jgi:hypothetical protein
MVIVFGDEICEVDQAHRCPQPWVSGGTFQIRVARGSQRRDERASLQFEAIHELRQRPIVMVGVVCCAVGEIRNGQFRSTGKNVSRARSPEWLEIREMTKLFRGTPSGGHRRRAGLGSHRTEARRSSLESFENGGQQTVVFNRQKRSVKPGGAAHQAMLSPRQGAEESDHSPGTVAPESRVAAAITRTEVHQPDVAAVRARSRSASSESDQSFRSARLLMKTMRSPAALGSHAASLPAVNRSTVPAGRHSGHITGCL